MVLDEADQALLVSGVRQQVQPDPLGVALLQPVVEPLVVAVVEALLLQGPLQVPVGLGEKAELGPAGLDGRNECLPVVGRGRCADALAPGAPEDVVHHQHRHVATDPITLTGDRGHRVEGRSPQAGLEGVELQDVRPGWEVGVAPAGEHAAR